MQLDVYLNKKKDISDTENNTKLLRISFSPCFQSGSCSKTFTNTSTSEPGEDRDRGTDFRQLRNPSVVLQQDGCYEINTNMIIT